jgi:parvulin-like peptidyl-prolyl isomerase
LSGCADSGSGSGKSQLPGMEALHDGNKQVYAELKGVPERAEDRIDRTFEVFRQRVGVAAHLAGNELSDDEAAGLLGLEAYSNALIDYHFDRYLDKAVSEESLKAFYEENPESFAIKKVRLGTILLRTHSRMSPEELEQKKAQAVDIVKQLRAGAGFAEMVERFSEDLASRDEGGDIGWLDTVSGDPALVNAALALEIGQYSDPLQTSRGFQIITLLEEPLVEPQPFETIKDKLRYRLQEDAKKIEWERLQKASGTE